MKRILNHPPEDPNGKKYWRGLEEYSKTAEFQGWLKQEFPQGSAEFWGDDLSRRSFLKIMGASMALAGLGLSGCRRPEGHIVPFTKTPEWMVPGRFLRYTTSMPRRNGHVSLLVTTFEGRPVKIEGNPLHAEVNGKSDMIAQASLLNLYDPERSRRFLREGKEITADECKAELAKIVPTWSSSNGSGVAFLADEPSSPTRERLRQELKQKYPQAVWATYEPLQLGGEAEAVQALFGARYRVIPNFEKANVILSIDSDFLGIDAKSLRGAREFARRRRAYRKDVKMNRLYSVEPRYTITGGQADHRLRVAPSQMGAFLVAFARQCDDLGVKGNLSAALSAVPQDLTLAGFDDRWVREAARDFIEHGGKSLILVGEAQPSYVHALAFELNNALGNIGETLEFTAIESAPSQSIQDLAASIKEGKVTSVVILGGNPVYNAPVDLEWKKLQQSLAVSVYLGADENETSEVSTWHIPSAHYLETWHDGWAADGSYLAGQPMVLPLFGGWSQNDLLNALLGKAWVNGSELVQETFRARYGSDEKTWAKFLHDGLVKDSDKSARPGFVGGRVSDIVRQQYVPAVLDGYEVAFVNDYSLEDGRHANNGWLQECPDPVTKLTWDNAALVSPATAKELGLIVDHESNLHNGIAMGQDLKITVDGREITIPALIAPGHADKTITLALGYGRSKVGKVGTGSGTNVYPIRTAGFNYFAAAKVEPTGKKRELAVTQEHYNVEGRALVREGTVKEFEENPKFPSGMDLDAHTPPAFSFYKNPHLEGEHQWGMVMDLSSCTGCNACITACQSENNIPIVGREQVKVSREMHWIRSDRYFTGEDINNPDMVMQPLTCMHCENAPCETVCPVAATTHSQEGLNMMTYNRCIGTRYCANNCPYKVRRFNFFDYNQRPLDHLYWGPLTEKGAPPTIKMMRNPNVTVRMRGVIEKCSFCVQRLETAKIDYKVANKGTNKRKLPTDSVMTACQQACPSEAIIFGDISDPESQVAKLKTQPHNYGLLTYLNTVPRVTYLARLRNPNPAMPDAAIGSDFDVPKPKHHAGASHEEVEGEEKHAPAAVKGGH